MSTPNNGIQPEFGPTCIHNTQCRHNDLAGASRPSCKPVLVQLLHISQQGVASALPSSSVVFIFCKVEQRTPGAPSSILTSFFAKDAGSGTHLLFFLIPMLAGQRGYKLYCLRQSNNMAILRAFMDAHPHYMQLRRSSPLCLPG
jgi:hypothetical protein